MFKVSVGSSALSAFRLEKLRTSLNTIAPGVVICDVRHCYFSALSAETLDEAQSALLDRVLNLDGSVHEPDGEYVPVLVVPRLGTISPWSTKATDIAQHCGLTGVQRIERGVIYYLGKRLTEAERTAILPLLHDRMTESVLDVTREGLRTGFDGAAEKIFNHGAPQPLAHRVLALAAAARPRSARARAPDRR